jgi:hypothetical protein
VTSPDGPLPTIPPPSTSSSPRPFSSGAGTPSSQPSSSSAPPIQSTPPRALQPPAPPPLSWPSSTSQEPTAAPALPPGHRAPGP